MIRYIYKVKTKELKSIFLPPKSCTPTEYNLLKKTYCLIYICPLLRLQLIHTDVWQKQSQYCRVIILQLKVKLNKNDMHFRSWLQVYMKPAIIILWLSVPIEQWNGASPVALLLKNLSSMQKTQVQPLGQEGSLEKGMTTHSSLVWRIPWTEVVSGLQSMGLQRVRQD